MRQRFSTNAGNFGLHDLKRLDDGEPQVTLDNYRRYLHLFTRRLKQTGARLIFATTTPVPGGKVSPPRIASDVEKYNAAAIEIMREENVSVNDLYAFALPRLREIQQPVNVHFTNSGSEQLASQVANAIKTQLKSPARD